MSYLRFCPDDYRAICQLADQLPLCGIDLPALQHFLVAHLPLDRLELAQQISRLDQRHLRLLYEHLRERSKTGVEGRPSAFSAEELKVVAQACDAFRQPVRFLRYYQDVLVGKLSSHHLALARKLARLSERQFARLYRQLKGQPDGNA